MPKYDHKKLKYSDQEKLLKLFVRAILKLGTERTVTDFLKDILNRGERVMIVRRLLVAKMLTEGKTYDVIRRQLKVGKATIARTERWLNFGRGGLKKAVKALNKMIK